MEREILNKRRPSSPKKTSEISLHRGGEGPLPDADALYVARGFAKWFLCVAPPSRERSRAGGPKASRARPVGVPRELPKIWQSSASSRVAGARNPDRTPSGCPADAPRWDSSSTAKEILPDDEFGAHAAGGAEPGRAKLRNHGTQSGVGRRRHLSAHA